MTEQHDIQGAARALATLIATIKEREARLVESVEREINVLRQVASQVDTRVAHALDGASQRITQQARQALDGALAPALKHVDQATVHTAKRLQDTAEALHVAERAWATRTTRLVLLTYGALLLASILPIAGITYMVRFYEDQMERHRVQAELMRAFNQADVVLCGERLCAKVEKDAKRVGQRGQYVPVNDRTGR